MPFAHVPGNIAGTSQDLGDCHLIKPQIVLGSGREQLGILLLVHLRIHGRAVPERHMQPRRVFSSENRSPRGRTNGGGGIRIGEPHSLPGQPIDMGRLVQIGTVAPQVSPSQIVNHQEDDV